MLDMQTFDSQLVALINAALEVESAKENVKRVIENLSEWCKELPQQVRRLLLMATTVRSRYSATVVLWIINVSTALYAISTAEGCGSSDGDRFKDRASWMMSAINFVPHDQPSVEVMRAVGIPEQLLRMSHELRKFDLLSEAIELGKISEGWLLGTIPHTDVWDFAEGLFGLAALYADPFGAAKVAELVNRIQSSLPPNPGYTPDYRAAVIAQIKEHLRNIETADVDMTCYAEGYAANSPLSALKANVASIVQAL